MTQEIIIALDEGTTNAKAVAVQQDGRVLAKASRPLTIQTPQQGWVEQSGEQLLSASLSVLAEVFAAVDPGKVAGIAISNQRETTIGWYRASGKPIHAAITWQCSRSAPLCHQLHRDHCDEPIRASTGLPIAPLFSASKMRWLLDNLPQGQQLAEQGEICLGTIDSWLLWHLSGGSQFATDPSNASRTQLFNIHRGEWDPDMLALFHIPRAALAQVQPTSSRFALTRGVPGIPDGVPILAMAGDSHAALFGHAQGRAGCVKATYGTGSSIMAPVAATGEQLPTLATTVAWHDGKTLTHALEGNIPHTGDAVAWMDECTGLSELPPDELARELARLPASVDSTLGVYFVPALTGLGAPWWNDQARGVICGLSRGVTRAHLVRAALEAITYQIADVLAAMAKHPDFQLEALMVDGGPTRNDWLMQYQADLLGCPVMRSDVAELSALGVAMLAQRTLMGNGPLPMAHGVHHDTFTPAPPRHIALQTCWREWQAAVQKSLPASAA